jgi:hypothetical protein
MTLTNLQASQQPEISNPFLTPEGALRQLPSRVETAKDAGKKAVLFHRALLVRFQRRRR